MADATTETHIILRLTDTEAEELNALLFATSKVNNVTLTPSQLATLAPIKDALYREISR